MANSFNIKLSWCLLRLQQKLLLKFQDECSFLRLCFTSDPSAEWRCPASYFPSKRNLSLPTSSIPTHQSIWRVKDCNPCCFFTHQWSNWAIKNHWIDVTLSSIDLCFRGQIALVRQYRALYRMWCHFLFFTISIFACMFWKHILSNICNFYIDND